jgi:hypothetical protein
MNEKELKQEKVKIILEHIERMAFLTQQMTESIKDINRRLRDINSKPGSPNFSNDSNNA